MILNKKDITNLTALIDIAVRTEGLQIARVAIDLHEKLEKMKRIEE